MSQIDTWLRCCESSFTGHLYGDEEGKKKKTSFVIRGLYEQLRSSKLSTEHKSQIQRDIGRTFPSKSYFSGEDAMGQLHLYDVLHVMNLIFVTHLMCWNYMAVLITHN